MVFALELVNEVKIEIGMKRCEITADMVDGMVKEFLETNNLSSHEDKRDPSAYTTCLLDLMISLSLKRFMAMKRNVHITMFTLSLRTFGADTLKCFV